MGFLDDLLGGFTKQIKELSGNDEETLRYKERYQYESDEYLKDEYRRLKGKSGDQNRKKLMAVAKLLKERGYDS